MYKYIICVFSILLASADADPCVTPLGAKSECITIDDCASLTSALKQIPRTRKITDFVRESYCGFIGFKPKVCCGPMPPHLQLNSNQGLIIKSRMGVIEPADLVDQSDSYPEPRPICGRDPGGDRLLGDNRTELDEFPWMALLVYQRPGGDQQYLCGGSLINRRYVLTAAHCLSTKFQQNLGELITVRLGEYDIDKNEDCMYGECADPPQEIPVQALYPHPGYSDNNKNKADDIGLVRLSRRAKYSDYVKPICLVSNENSRYDVGIAVFIAGWGRTDHGHHSSTKLKVILPIYDKSNCSCKYSRKYKMQLTEKQLCAGGVLNKDACAGDSGGPLMRLVPGDIWEAVAVGSFGYGCALKEWPSVYTSVVSYLNWIQAKMIETNI